MVGASVDSACLAESHCYFYYFQNGRSLEINLFFSIHTKKNYTLFLTKQMYPATNPERPRCWRGLWVFFVCFLHFSQKHCQS